MVVTRSWLNEWIDLSGICTSDLCKKLNDLGLEVDGHEELQTPQNVVVGKVLSCKKHPDADKLNICEVDVGTDTRQIVCGAKNVKDAEYVAVAMIGAVLPGGLEIKHTKLRGQASEGMICSSQELGFAKINDGIMILDAGIGSLEPGRQLHEYAVFNDTVIEIDLTPNRGDCLSVHGIARDLSAAFNKELQTLEEKEYKESIGIGKILNFVYEDIEGVNMHYKVADIKTVTVPLKVQLRLAQIEKEITSPLEKLMAYSSHESGVVLRAYDFAFFGSQKVKLELKEDKRVELFSGKDSASIVGINQNDKSRVKGSKVILEASYIRPEKIVPAVAKQKLQTDGYFFNTSRGSEPDVDFGMQALCSLLADNSDSAIYSGSSTLYANNEKKSISVNVKALEDLIGQSVDKTDVTNVLKHLGFTIQNLDGERFGVIVPPFRHDIENMEDISEEIVRMIGIDNIAPKRLRFEEHNRVNDTLKHYRFKKELKHQAVAQGYFEVMTYLFCENARLEKNGFETVQKNKALINPITSDMDGLRTTLLMNMLEAAKNNFNYGKRKVKLFETGTVFDKKRNETQKLAFVHAGAKEDDNVGNSGKPKRADIFSFIEEIGGIIGDFEITSCSEKNRLVHPFQSGDIIKHGEKIGFISKLHLDNDFDLEDAFIAEVSLDALIPALVAVEPVSNYQGSSRDLSVLIDQDMAYEKIRAILRDLDIASLGYFYPVDIFEDASLKGKKSLTLRFFIQSDQHTLQDKEVNAIMDEILQTLQSKAKASLR
ncbi:MAG: phenylalanine--tRNA ligase subunit beta [Campylobacterota bacterium]